MDTEWRSIEEPVFDGRTIPAVWPLPATRDALIEAGKKPVAWIVEPIIPAAGVTIIFGPPKSLKSRIANALGLAVANGFSIGPWDIPEPVACGYVSWEDSQARLGRQLLVNERQIKGDLIPDIWPSEIAPTIKLPLNEDQVIDMLRARGWKMLTLDVMLYLSDSDSENDSAKVQPLCASCRHIVAETGCAILLVHHSRKSGEYMGDVRELARGSSAISGMADSLLYVTAEKGRYRMKAVPKDAPEMEFRIAYDPDSATVWNVEHAPTRADEREEEVLKTILALGGVRVTVKHVADELHVSKNTVAGTIMSLRLKGILDKEDGPRGVAMFTVKEDRSPRN